MGKSVERRRKLLADLLLWTKRRLMSIRLLRPIQQGSFGIRETGSLGQTFGHISHLGGIPFNGYPPEVKRRCPCARSSGHDA